MSHSRIHAKMFDMVLCFSRALDLLHDQISDHHLLVANIGSQIAEAAGFDEDACLDTVLAGALHDVGLVSVAARLALCDFSLDTYRSGSDDPAQNIHRHGHEGWLLLQGFAPFAPAAEIIRYHHVNWQHGAGESFAGKVVPSASHVIHLADRIAVLPRPGEHILDQRERIVDTIRAASGSVFHPELVAAFETLASRDAFWFDLVYPHQEALLRSRTRGLRYALDINQLQDLAAVFGRIIDFRSPFTATHSSGVAAAASGLAELLGMSGDGLKLMNVAGHLHDLGKLAVPPEILDKPGPLDREEASIMRSHVYHTYRILETVPGLETVNLWASFHHERLGGNGYPFRPDSLPLGSRIVAVADVFTALSEDRPYRRGMARDEVVAILRREVAAGALDGDVVATLLRNYEALDHRRHFRQQVRAENDGPLPPSMHKRAGWWDFLRSEDAA